MTFLAELNMPQMRWALAQLMSNSHRRRDSWTQQLSRVGVGMQCVSIGLYSFPRLAVKTNIKFPIFIVICFVRSQTDGWVFQYKLYNWLTIAVMNSVTVFLMYTIAQARTVVE